LGLAGCFVVPHPPVIVPEVGGRHLRAVATTVESMLRLGQEARALDPDVIVLLSPHAPLQADRMGVGLAVRYRGSLRRFGAAQVELTLDGDVELAQAILEDALAFGVPVGPLDGFAELMDLDHGTVVPLSFIVRGLDRPVKLVLLSFSFLDMQAHLTFGEAIASAIDAAPCRVLYVASGDLSHRLTSEAPAGYNPLGQEFDERVVAAFSEGTAEAMLRMPPGLLRAAGECGYRSLVVMMGVLSGRQYGTRVLSYEGPFGVGYLVGAVDLANDDEPREV
jgi:aromatic ring-opening dioxygenase LigB subunit